MSNHGLQNINNGYLWMLGVRRIDPGALTEDDWGVGQLMRRRAFLRGDWRATGRDSLPGARSVGGQGGAIGFRWSKCPGLRHPPEPSPSRRLERQVRAVLSRGGPGPRQLELRPRYRRGPGGRGGLDAARGTGVPGERPRAWVFGGRLRPAPCRTPAQPPFLIVSSLLRPEGPAAPDSDILRLLPLLLGRRPLSSPPP